MGLIGIGIDFGTTNSVLAVYDGKKALAMTDRDTGLPHPSMVWFHEDKVVVGQEAKKYYPAYVDEPGHVFIRSVKRTLGQRPDYNFHIFGRKVSAWEVVSRIFQYLAENASGQMGSVRECVVTVPIYFDGYYRSLIRSAAEQAGFFIKAFIHEPLAALVGYLEGQGDGLRASLDRANVLVFDWGGGTLDITLVRIEDGRFYEIGTGGLTDIAGDQFDETLQRLVLDRFFRRHGLDPEVLELGRDSIGRLTGEAERAKIRLSSEINTDIELARFYRGSGGPLALQEPVRRIEFEQTIQGYVARALKEVERVLVSAGVGDADVDLALMIGGTSMIPLVDRTLRKMFGNRVKTVDNAPTIIAEGAAVIAHRDWSPCLVYPLSLRLADDTLYPLYPAGALLLPEATAKQMTMYCTDPRDGEARLVLVEGIEHTAGGIRNCNVLTVPITSNVNRYNIERIYVSMEFDPNHVLQLRAHGSISQRIAEGQVYDLRFGLRTRA